VKETARGLGAGVSRQTAKLQDDAVLRGRACQGESKNSSVQKSGGTAEIREIEEAPSKAPPHGEEKARELQVKILVSATEERFHYAWDTGLSFVFDGFSARRRGLLQRAVAGFPAGGAHP
jgi:hypothetical protein